MAIRMHVVTSKSISVYFAVLIVGSVLLLAVFFGIIDGPKPSIHYSGIYCNYDRNSHSRYENRSSDVPGMSSDGSIQNGGVRVFVLSAMRSGSSFLSEIFGQRDDFFYTFEPCSGLDFFLKDKGLSRSLLVPKCSRLCEEIFRCDFARSGALRKWLTHSVGYEFSSGIAKLLPALMGSTCNRTVFNGTESALCRNITAPELARVCSSKRHIAIKSIRLYDISQLATLLTRDGPSVKVIHLARDPRGVLSSRYKKFDEYHRVRFYQKAGFDYDDLNQYCASWVSNRERGEYLPWMSGKYYLIRYEDFARFPSKYTSEIYNFLGLSAEIPRRVRRWIEENTKGAPEEEVGDGGYYTTRRKSNETYDEWRETLPYRATSLVQGIHACADMMKMFGYLRVTSEEDLLDRSKSLLDSLPFLNSSGASSSLGNT